jgi:hypothetical protein
MVELDPSDTLDVPTSSAEANTSREACHVVVVAELTQALLGSGLLGGGAVDPLGRSMRRFEHQWA